MMMIMGAPDLCTVNETERERRGREREREWCEWGQRKRMQEGSVVGIWILKESLI